MSMKLEVKVNDGGFLIDATMEVKDGVILVTPVKALSKEEEEKWKLQRSAIEQFNGLRRELFDKLIEKRIETYNSTVYQIQKPMRYTKYFKEEVDYRENIHNNSAKDFYEKCGSKVKELSFESGTVQHSINLMHCKHCIKYALNMCKSKTQLVLRDEFDKTYNLKFNCKDCEMYITN